MYKAFVCDCIVYLANFSGLVDSIGISLTYFMRRSPHNAKGRKAF